MWLPARFRRRSHSTGRSRAAKLKLLLVSIVVLLLVGVGYFWLRSSSLVAVEQVEVKGLQGVSRSASIRAVLEETALDMTTLDIDRQQLADSVSLYPAVERIEVERDFPHRIRIRVFPRHPLAVIVHSGRKVPVASDGTVLRGQLPSSSLPSIPAATAPVGQRVSDRKVLLLVKVVAAAPKQLQQRIVSVRRSSRGLMASLRSGPKIYFGDGRKLQLKWKAAIRVIADPQARGAAYIDVQVPSRPAVGGDSCSGGLECPQPTNIQLPQA